MFLITAFPRSGTQYSSNVLNAIGIDAPHQRIGSDGVVSWFHAAGGGKLSFAGEIEPYDHFDVILHQTRHPLKAIASAQTLIDESYEFIFSKVGHPGGTRSLRWAMWAWLKWNELIESITNQRFRIEDIETDCLKILDQIGFAYTEKFNFPNIPKFINTRVHDVLTWKDLFDADPELAGKISEKAVQYGYKLIDGKRSGLPTVSAIMMMKDEAENLPRCLSSIKDFVDQIFIVDTGSTDDSIAIAESYGARVFIHPWQDFSTHRNQSIEYASGSADWLFQVDCDEQFYCDDPIAFRKWLAAIPAEQNGVAITLIDVREVKTDPGVYEKMLEFNPARIFRDGTIHFKEIVHNEPKFGNDAAWHYPGAHLKHFGYDLPPEKMAAKHKRTKTLLKKRILQNPDDYLAYFLISQTFGAMGDIENAIKYAEQYVGFADKDPDFNQSAYYSLITMHHSKKNFKRVYEILQIAVPQMPDDLDLAMAETELGVDLGDPNLIVNGAGRYLRNYQKMALRPAGHSNRYVYSNCPECFGFCLYYLILIKMKESIQCFKMFAGTLPKMAADIRAKNIESLAIEINNLFKDFKNGGEICHLILTNLNEPIGKTEPSKKSSQI